MGRDPLARKAIKKRFFAKHPGYMRNEWLVRRYGITAAEWNALFDTQGRRCKVCKTDKPMGKYWHTDHGGPLPCTREEIRGILCMKCNHEIGAGLRSDAVRLRNAMQYVEHFL